jgi:hypothetical protein
MRRIGWVATATGALLGAALACGSGSGSGGNGTGTGGDSGPSSSGGSSGSGSSSGGLPITDAGLPDTYTAGSCTPDVLKTGLVAMQTGVSVDAFDCSVLTWTAHYAEPDPMIFKAIMYVESRFDNTSVACPNMPCGVPSGWNAQTECGCYGLMQIVPACMDDPGDAGILPNGHPDLAGDAAVSGWSNSVFDPDVNIHIGIAGVAGNRKQEEQKFPGCTTDQYTLMAVGDYNEYGSTKSCTEYNTQYDDAVLMAYQQYATAAGYTTHAY